MISTNALWGPTAITHYLFMAAKGDGGFRLSGGKSFGGLFTAHKTGTIDAVGFRNVKVGGTPPDYNVGIYTVDGNLKPTNTNYGGSSSYDTNTFNTLGWHWYTLAAPASATKGDIFATVIKDSGTPGTFANYIDLDNTSAFLEAYPMYVYNSGFGWNINTGSVSAVACRYSDGTIVGFPVDEYLYAVFNTGTTPSEAGLKFIPPFDMNVKGIDFLYDGYNVSAATGGFDVKLYDGGGTTIGTINVTHAALIDTYSNVKLWFDSPVALTNGNTYRLTLKPINASGFYIGHYEFLNTNDKAVMPDAANWAWTERTGVGAWTDQNLWVPHIGLILDAVDTPCAPASSGPMGWVG